MRTSVELDARANLTPTQVWRPKSRFGAKSDFKMLRFYDHGMNNAQSYQYDADGDLIGDYGEQWILFKGKVEDHGDGRHIHVPPQTAVRWSRLPANENYQH